LLRKKTSPFSYVSLLNFGLDFQFKIHETSRKRNFGHGLAGSRLQISAAEAGHSRRRMPEEAMGILLARFREMVLNGRKRESYLT
jgi:hypothetical protein